MNPAFDTAMKLYFPPWRDSCTLRLYTNLLSWSRLYNTETSFRLYLRYGKRRINNLNVQVRNLRDEAANSQQGTMQNDLLPVIKNYLSFSASIMLFKKAFSLKDLSSVKPKRTTTNFFDGII